MSSWLGRFQSGEPGYEAEVVERYTIRLLEFARRQLPERMRRRVDPEDVVQSVYRSFFRRVKNGQFSLEDSLDVWRLLAAMTFHKATKAVRFHHQKRRDVRRETTLPESNASRRGPAISDPAPGPEDVATLLECAERLCGLLPVHHRAVFLLRLEGFSIEEIAQRVNRSQGTVLRVLARVRELAAKQLEEGA
jgi:RNA polymerase sigma-70 factor, ECF subfamily